MNTTEKIHTVKSVKNIQEYVQGDIEKLTMAASSFVTASIGLCTFTKNNLGKSNINIEEEIKKEISNKLINEENDQIIGLYNYFYNDDKRKVL